MEGVYYGRGERERVFSGVWFVAEATVFLVLWWGEGSGNFVEKLGGKTYQSCKKGEG